VLLDSSRVIQVVVTDNLGEKAIELVVVSGGLSIAAKARILVFNSSAHTSVEDLEIIIGKGLALIGLQEGSKMLAAPVSRVGLQDLLALLNEGSYKSLAVLAGVFSRCGGSHSVACVEV